MALSVNCSCCALVIASAECCGYLCYPSTVMRSWPLWSNPVPLSLIRCTCVVPLFLRCCVIYHMVLIALRREKVLRLPLRSYRLSNRIPQFRFDTPTQSVSWSLWYFRLDESLQFSPNFPLDQTNRFLKLLDLYSSQRFCEQVRRVILPWDMTDRDTLVFDLFPYIMVPNIHMFNPRLLRRIRC